MPNGAPALTETIPDYRTVVLGKASLSFSYSKDPEDQAWFRVDFGERLASVASVSVADAAGAEQPATLAESATAVTTDGMAAVFLMGGTSGKTYAVRLGVVTLGGDTLFRTVLLSVAAQ